MLRIRHGNHSGVGFRLRLLGLLYRVYPPCRLLAEYRHALEAAERYKCRRVLDVGCGGGNLAGILLHHGPTEFYVGLDVNNVFRRRGEASFILSDARWPPVRPRSFDCVFFVNSIFYIGLGALEEYTGIAKYVVIVDIDPSYPHVRVADWIEGLGRPSRSKLVAQLSRKYVIHEATGGATYRIVLSG